MEASGNPVGRTQSLRYRGPVLGHSSKGIAKPSPFIFPPKRVGGGMPVLTYFDGDEFGAGFCERNVYLVKNRKTVGFVWTCEMRKL